ncbi:sce7726 family protein [uncultured Lactobacillus sp.]|uniref:sce7726 family protein n=1 Tax=uncultured Lactobacillus sp. TaxID=153152 RepID=UPI0025F5C3A0|nr:sce7726 family protein [uncultured Lactobacillus sp.]
MDSLINRVFTKTNINQILTSGKSVINEIIIDKYSLSKQIETQEDAFNAIYNFMKRNYRNEYYYKNQLLNNLLIGRHSLNTTSAIRELPISNSIADFILINGKAQVFEIKSGLDSLKRLTGQLQDYYKAFTYVNVIMDEVHLKKVEKAVLNKNVGLYVLTKRNTIKKIREANEYNNLLDHTVIFKILRKKEYEEILLKYFGKLSSADDFHYFRDSLKIFKQLPIEVAQQELTTMLKLRYLNKYKDNNSLILSFSPALREVIYFSDYRKKQIEELNQRLQEKYE